MGREENFTLKHLGGKVLHWDGVKGIGHTRILGKRITSLPRIGPDKAGFFHV